jgi:Tfp pilus assembly protein PilN
MRVRLNLATKPLVTHRKFLVAFGTTGVIAALVFLGMGWHVYRVRRAAEDVRYKTRVIEKELDAYSAQRSELEQFYKQPENAKLHDRAAYLNSMIDARSFDWTQMFMDMERLLPAGVRVINIGQKLEGGRVIVTLTVGASSDEAKLKFLRALEHSREFSNMKLLSEHAPSGVAGAGAQSVLELKGFYTRI